MQPGKALDLNININCCFLYSGMWLGIDFALFTVLFTFLYYHVCFLVNDQLCSAI